MLFNRKKNYGLQSDYFLIAIIIFIIVFGLINLSSASAIISYQKFGNAFYYFRHQLIGFFAGAVGFWYFSNTDYHRWKKYSLSFLLFSVILLLLVFIPGLQNEAGTARSWIRIFGVSMQPAEFVKLSFLFYLAAWLEPKKGENKEPRNIWSFLTVLGLISFLMVLQPDVGTLSIIALSSIAVYFIGGGKLSHIFFIFAFAGVAIFALAVAKPYQANRFKCFYNPDFDRQEKCYQVNQALIAVGSGGIFGRGLGESRQKYSYLPEVKGDSIFAITAEEVGLAFSSLLILAYLFLFYRGYLISRRANDIFGKNLAIGISSWIVIQAIINIGGIINALPMTGVPLPLVSYGGTSALATLSALGVLVNIGRQSSLFKR